MRNLTINYCTEDIKSHTVATWIQPETGSVRRLWQIELSCDKL